MCPPHPRPQAQGDPQRHQGRRAAPDAFGRQQTKAAEARIADLHVQVRGSVAVVTGTHRLAMSIGYRHAPVVVATNPRFRWQGGPEHVKHTVARWNTMTVAMDWDRMPSELQSAEPGWGGSASIVGSPQGIASRLTTEQVVEIVARHAEPGE